MTGSAFRCWTLWLNTIASKGRRVWEEGGEKFSPIGRNWVTLGIQEMTGSAGTAVDVLVTCDS